MREPNTQRLLTNDELHSLLAPMPIELQQRESLVRIDLRPGLPTDYVGPVELDDLRLWLSPWHWQRHELAVSSHSKALSQSIAEARAVGESLETVAATPEQATEWPLLLNQRPSGTIEGMRRGQVHQELFSISLPKQDEAYWLSTKPGGASKLVFSPQPKPLS